MGPPIALTDTRIPQISLGRPDGQFTEVVNPQPPPANWESRCPSAFLNVSPPGAIPGGPSGRCSENGEKADRGLAGF